MPFKRFPTKVGVRPRKMYRKKPKTAKISKPLANTVRAIVKRQLNKVVETKKSVFSTSDGTEIYHNNFITLDDDLLYTTQGTTDPNATDNQNRIGDKVLCKGVSLRMMIELNERFSDVTFRLIVVRSSRNDTPTRSTLFCGTSGNKMLDTINTERFTIIAQKYFKIKAANPGAIGGTYGGALPSGYYDQNAGQQVLSRATKMLKLWIPAYKFGKGGVITYDSGSSNPKQFDYHVFLYSYSNYTTSQDIYYIARCNDYVRTMYFQDA